MLYLTFFNNTHQIKTTIGTYIEQSYCKLKDMKSIREQYVMLKRRAKQAMINGQLNYYLQLILEAEQLSLVLIDNKRR